MFVAACGGGGGGSSSSSSDTATPPKAFHASWTSAPQDLTEGLPGAPHVTPDIVADQTVREVAHLSIGGDGMRVKISNLFGTTPLVLDAVHVARSPSAGAIDPANDRAVTFAGSALVTIAPGAEATSDPVALPVPPLTDVAVSMHLPQATALATGHKSTTNGSIIADGNQVVAATIPGTPSGNLYFVKEIDVSSADPTHVVVAFGDSITDGSQSTPGAHTSYPEELAVHASGNANPRIAVVDAGIGGNRWLQDDPGPAGIHRFDTDVLGVEGVTHAIVLLGINDFEVARAFGQQPVAADALISATSDAIARAKARNVKVLLGTITPYKGSTLFNADDETQRQAFNTWARGNHDVAAIVDFDSVLRDPADPQSIAPQFSSADHLHPNDAGYAAMAAAVDLASLR